MTTSAAAVTIAAIAAAATWEQRIAQIRLIPQNHGTGEHAGIYAELARALYVPHLAPDFAYVHEAPFYEPAAFEVAYTVALEGTHGFNDVSVAELATLLEESPETLLVFRTILGLTSGEFAHATALLPAALGLDPLSLAKVNSMERTGSRTSLEQARTAAETVDRVISGDLFGAPGGNLRSKQAKADTVGGWESVRAFARDRVPYSVFLHQRHYGGAFRQVLDATSTKRGDLIEDAVARLFEDGGIPHIRTGAHNQAEIVERFGVVVAPAPDFVVFDANDSLRALLECKGANDGGTARDKALRFKTLRGEATRLGGIPLIAVLGGMGWARVNDTLGPVVRDTDGRVFTLSTLRQMLEVAPFQELGGGLRPGAGA